MRERDCRDQHCATCWTVTARDARSLRAGIEVGSNDPGQIQAALEELPELLKERPADAALHYYLGRAHVAQGDTDAAGHPSDASAVVTGRRTDR